MPGKASIMKEMKWSVEKFVNKNIFVGTLINIIGVITTNKRL